MKSDRSAAAMASRKSPTGIAGFDEITGGGLPRGRTTLLAGGPRSGKTISSLQFLINGARRREIYRRHEWLLTNQLTCLITLKAGADDPSTGNNQPYGFMQFMVDCSVILSHSVVITAGGEVLIGTMRWEEGKRRKGSERSSRGRTQAQARYPRCAAGRVGGAIEGGTDGIGCQASRKHSAGQHHGHPQGGDHRRPRTDARTAWRRRRGSGPQVSS